MAATMVVTVVRAGDQRETFTVKPATIVAFERHFGVGLGALSTDARMEYIYWLTWEAERRSGAVVKPFDGWLEDVEDVELADDADPLEVPAATPVS
jgi:hypothetical protein